MNFNMKDNSTAALVVAATAGLDVAGQPGVFAGPLTYSVDDATVVAILPSADGSQVVINRVGTTGVATVSCTDGVITATFTVTILASETTSISFAEVVPPTAAPVDAAATPA